MNLMVTEILLNNNNPLPKWWGIVYGKNLGDQIIPKSYKCSENLGICFISKTKVLTYKQIFDTIKERRN